MKAQEELIRQTQQAKAEKDSSELLAEKGITDPRYLSPLTTEHGHDQ